MSAAEQMPNLGLRLFQLPQERALEEFHAIAPFLEKGVQASMGRVSLQSIHAGIVNGEFMPFIIVDTEANELKAVILCEAAQYPHKSVFTMSLCGGEDVTEWAHFIDHFREVARRMEFDQFEIVGRPGWGRVCNIRPQVHTFVEELASGQQHSEDAG